MKQAQSKNNQDNKMQLREKKKALTKEAILTAAEGLFLQKPMEKVHIDDIAEAAVISRMTLYNYFKNKDTLYFQIGTRFFEQVNTMIESMVPSEASGLEQMLGLCQGIFVNSLERPLVTAILREFYLRLKQQNFSVENLYRTVIQERNFFTEEWKDIEFTVERFKTDISKSDELENLHLINYFLQVLRFENLYLQAIQKGKTDGSITNSLENHQMLHYLFIMIEGIIEQMELRASNLEMINLDKDIIVNTSLDLISHFLRKS